MKDMGEDKGQDIQQPIVIGEPKGQDFSFSADITSPVTWRSFFRLTGGSIFYCLSAILVAYGIVKVMGPILAESTSFAKALPCLITLHIYEIALLGVLLLIVSRKVVDDAISLAIIVALFLIGTSAAQGSVADMNIRAGLIAGLVGIALAAFKLYCMKRFARFALGALPLLGLLILMACNYMGPVLLAHSVAVHPSNEPARRELWMLLWLGLLAAGTIILLGAMRKKHLPEEQVSRPFLQRPVMGYVLALILLAASAAHQYAAASTFGLELALGDSAPISVLAVLLVTEILRHLGKRFGYTTILISCLPIAVMLWAIYERQAPANSQWGFGIIAYPPVFFALAGLAIVIVALYHRWYRLLYVAFFYGLGVVLTYGYSPEHPHDLNIDACMWTLAAALIIYGVIIRNQFSYLPGLIVLCLQLERESWFAEFVKSQSLTEVGTLAGVCGIGIMFFYLLFANRLSRPFHILGALGLSVFLYDYLPNDIHWRYLIAAFGAGCLMAVLWRRDKDILLVAILAAPFGPKLYIVTKRLEYWRPIIAGFLLLAAGAFISLRKQPGKDQDDGNASGAAGTQ